MPSSTSPRGEQARPRRPRTVTDPAPDTGPAGHDLPLPNERDGSTGNTAAKPDEVMRRAKRDIDAGLVDTDLRATPGLDAGRRDRLLRDAARPKRR